MRATGWDLKSSARTTNALLTYRKCCLLTQIMLVLWQWQWEYLKCCGAEVCIHAWLSEKRSDSFPPFLSPRLVLRLHMFKEAQSIANLHKRRQEKECDAQTCHSHKFTDVKVVKIIGQPALTQSTWIWLELLVWSVCRLHLFLKRISGSSLECT